MVTTQVRFRADLRDIFPPSDQAASQSGALDENESKLLNSTLSASLSREDGDDFGKSQRGPEARLKQLASGGLNCRCAGTLHAQKCYVCLRGKCARLHASLLGSEVSASRLK